MSFTTKFRLMLVATLALAVCAPMAATAWQGPCAGYGRCGSCYCRGFEGRGNTCTNCGHNYSRHN